MVHEIAEEPDDSCEELAMYFQEVLQTSAHPHEDYVKLIHLIYCFLTGDKKSDGPKFHSPGALDAESHCNAGEDLNYRSS